MMTYINNWKLAVSPQLKDLDALASRSLINCHCRGLDSILFDDTPEKRLRLFITREDHTLWKNDVSAITGFREDMSVAVHPHHCAIRLIPVLGGIVNLHAKQSASGYPLKQWRYESPITKGQGKFTATGEVHKFDIFKQHLHADDWRSLAPKQMHTVWVPKGEVVAWLVAEGYEDEWYENVCYSNNDLAKFDFSGMYEPMGRSYLESHLITLGLL